MPRQRRWTDEQLASAVAASKTLAEVMRRVGLQAGRYDAIRKHIVRLEIPAGHLRMERGVRRRGGWSDVDLVTAVAESTTYADVMRRLGYTPSGGAHRWIKANVIRLGLSTAHSRVRPRTRAVGSGDGASRSPRSSSEDLPTALASSASGLSQMASLSRNALRAA